MINASTPGRNCLRRGGFIGIAALFGLLFTQVLASADELPAFRHGLWDFHRTMGAKSMETRKCTNPSENILQKSGCKVSEIKKTEDSFTFTADCPADSPMSPELGGHMTVVLKALSDSFYQVVAEGMINGQPMKEFIDARRVGECAR